MIDSRIDRERPGESGLCYLTSRYADLGNLTWPLAKKATMTFTCKSDMNLKNRAG